MKIKKEMKVSQVLRDYPETISVFMKYGLGCAGCTGCSMSEPESLEEAASVHNLDTEEFLKELNDLLETDGKTE